MVRHLKWNRGQVHPAGSKTGPENLCWAVPECEQTKGRRETEEREGPWAKDCSSARALAAQVMPKLRISQPSSVLNLIRSRNSKFFSQTHWQASFGPMYLEWGHSELGCAFSQGPVSCILAAEQPSPCREVLHPHFMVRVLCWEMGCYLEGPVYKQQPTSRTMGIKGKARLRPPQASWWTAATFRSGFRAVIPLLSSSGRHSALQWRWYSTEMSTEPE